MSAIEKVFRDKLNKIIIVDGYSKDKTVEIIEKHFSHLDIRLFFSKDKLGKVREFMIQKVRTEWFFFIDSDVKVNNLWFKKLTSYINNQSNIGAIQGFALPINLLLRKIRINKKSSRGFTSNTLLRKSAVKGIILPNISRGEDDLVKRYVESKGYKWIYTDAYCTHLKSTYEILKDFLKDFFIFFRSHGIKKALEI